MGFSGKLGSALIFLGICVSAAELAYGASFFGKSYVELKIIEASSKTSLSLQFQTSKSSGLLFLAAGETDYWLVELQSGSVQVKLELGSGEKILRSERGVKLNDLALHTLEIYHEGGEVTLTVDKHFTTSVKILGLLHELNIQHGIYVGGTGGFDKPYMEGAASNFRGCIDEVLFNQRDILSSLRTYSGFKNVHEVSAGCSDEFFAEDSEPVSLFSSKSYLEFALWNAQEEAVFECAVRTTEPLGLLLYNAGQQGDFVAMENAEGLIRVVIGKSGRNTHLSSLSHVNDNNWHYIKLRFTSKHLHLTVDEETVKVFLSSRSKNLKLRGPLFVGGIDDSTRVAVLKIGLLSLAGRKARGGSFRGCLKDVKANSAKKSLKNVLVTKDISAGCAAVKKSSTTFKTTTAQMLVIPTTSIPQMAVKPTAKAQTKKFLTLNNLVVAEGGETALESKHIKLNLEFKKLGVRQSQIIFKITKQPHRGYLKLDTGPEREQNSFTMLDLWYGRVLYVHDGSEYSHDHFSFSVFTSSKKVVPEYLKGDKQYLFNITITPTNDAPEIILPEGNLFILLENSKKCLASNVINAIDIDTNSTELQFSILGNLNANAGFLENAMNPGTAITTFSNTDLEEGNIYYIHRGVRTSRIVLRVSDGDRVSNTVVLRIMAVPVDYKVVNNTGLIVDQSDTALVTKYNLSVETNAVNQEVEIRYIIVKAPKYGEIQRLHSNGEWKKINSFSQRSVERGRVRYFGTFHELQSPNVTEMFRFKVSIGSETGEELVFPIIVKWVNFILLKNIPLVIDKGKKQALTSVNLLAVMEGARISESGLHYRLVTTPKRGQLLLDGEILKQNSSFSQKDISAQKVEYELIGKPHEDVEDVFSFQLFSKHAVSLIHNFHALIKADVNTINLTNKGLTLVEGEGELITRAELYAETLNTKKFLYTIIQSPRSGKLKRINRSDSTDSNDNITIFTNEDIIGQRLMYVHDDSESTHDEFIFVAAAGEATDNSEADPNSVSVLGTFTIIIQLKNDEKPVRVVDKVFHVVRNGQRLLTSQDLRYHDPDSDFNDVQLLYTRRGIPNGDLVLVNDTSKKLFQFSQEDLEQNRVLFVHHGADSGRFVLFVTDGKHYTSSLLEVSASDPYVRIANNTGLLVQKGQEKYLTTANFSVNTNLFIAEESEINYRVFLSPKHGALYLNGMRTESFTQNDLKNGQVVYRHDNSNNLVDKFNFTIKVKHLLLDGGVNVRIYLESHQRAPRIVHNSNLLVEEGKPVKISKKNLQVNEGLIAYEHTHTEAIGWSAEDSFQFIVFSPPASLEPQEFHITISYDNAERSSRLLANTGAVVTEGERILIDKFKLDASNLMVKLPESKRSLYEVWYQVISLPTHGVIVVGERNITKQKPYFSQFIVNKYGITYLHDDSESRTDNFTFAAWLNLKSKVALRPLNDSEVVEEMFNITITPINDQPPELKTKAPSLKVVQGYNAVLNSDHINAVDLDNLPEEIKYSIISGPNNGYVATAENLNISIKHFTQADINDGKIWFVQDGSSSSGVFYFSVTDGKHRPLYKLFNLEVIPIMIKLINNTQLEVQQGQSISAITNEHLAAETNGKVTAISYEITSPPQFGHILIGNKSVTLFEQEDLMRGHLTYHMNNLSASHDTFEFTVMTSEGNVSEQVVNITVRPLLKMAEDFKIPTGTTCQLGTDVLDASKLANQTGSVPKFEVKRLPTHGRFVRPSHMVRGRREAAKIFTQKDIELGLVLLEVEANMTGVDLLNDSFAFVLTANNVQPAEGTFLYSIIPFNGSKVQNITLNENPPLLNSTSTSGQLPLGTQTEMPTIMPTEAVPRWRNKSRWGNRKSNTSASAPDVTLASFVQQTTIEPVNGKPVAQAIQLSGSLHIILPLAFLAVLLIVIIIVVILMKQKKKPKHRPLISNCPNNSGTNSPSFQSVERSPTVPAVTVTRLNTSSALSPSPIERLNQMVTTATSSKETSTLLYNCNQIDAEMVHHCRTTNPTLRHNQYWV
uniref:chondroitin sulfate proteoglycan 4 isoform X2 n=1 Tax=Pristiophorus japonicus TaxID=55135 RepID=UPI00398EF69D